MTGRATSTTSRAASCDGKLVYASYSDAARLISKNSAATLEAYRCRYCGGYHIGDRSVRLHVRRTKEERRG